MFLWILKGIAITPTNRRLQDSAFGVAVGDELLISGSEDTTVGIWDTETGVPLLVLRGHEKRGT
jgi:WD40 repeat protein